MSNQVVTPKEASKLSNNRLKRKKRGDNIVHDINTVVFTKKSKKPKK